MATRMLKLLCGLMMLMAAVFALSVALADSPWDSTGNAGHGIKGKEVYVYTYNLDVYYEPTKKSEVLEIVPFAKRILFIAEKKGWAKVYTTNGRLGYCNAKQLTETDPNIDPMIVYCQQDRATYYLRPSTDSPVMGRLDRNEKTTLFAITPKHDWLRIKVGKYFCYIQRPYIDYEKYSAGQDAWVNVQSVPIYYDMDVENPFFTAYFGTHVRVVSQTGDGWAKIRSDGGLIGFCKAGVLSELDPNSLDITVYTQVAGSYLFDSSSDLSGHRAVSANTEMLLCAVDDDLYWARVRYQDQYYYVPYVFLSTERLRGDYKALKAKVNCSIREGTTQASGVITNVPAGTDLLLMGCTDNCAKVATMPDVNGARFIGFVKISELM